MREIDRQTLDSAGQEHLWMHFAPIGSQEPGKLFIVDQAEGCYFRDASGKQYLDGLSALYCVNIGHGRHDVLEAALSRVKNLGYFSTWNFAHPNAIEAASKVASLAPAGLDRVFFTSGGSESVESALKISRHYHKLRGNASKYKFIARESAYHGTSLGALSVTGIRDFKEHFEPLTPGGCHVQNTRDWNLGLTSEDPAEAIDLRIRQEGPGSVAAVILEPVQAGGGAIPPPDGYFRRVREICNEHDVLLISDEVICSWGRLGTWFGAQKFGYSPDLITTAKGITSGYAPMGALIISERVSAPFLEQGEAFAHGYTFGGHPLATAVALENIQVIEDDKLLDHVTRTEPYFQETLGSLGDIPIVRDVRGAGFLLGVELGPPEGPQLNPNEVKVLVQRLNKDLLDRGLFCRVDARAGYPCVAVAPPLIAGKKEIDTIVSILDETLRGVDLTRLSSD